jgi:carbonic anhydrase
LLNLFQFKLCPFDNEDFKPVTEKLVDIIDYNSHIIVNHFKLNDLLPTKVDKYFNYAGSLTTPTCDEVVNWLIQIY